MDNPEEYPDSVEDYEHNRPHYVIAYGAAAFVMWGLFLAGLVAGWLWL